MSRKGDTVLAASLKRYGKKIKTYIENCIADDLKVNLLIEDARDSLGKISGVVALELEIGKTGGWGNDNIIEIHGTIGLEKSGKRGKKEDEAYLDGVTVGDWEKGSKAIGLNGCSIGEFLVHIFTLFAIKAGNLSILLDNAAGSRGEHIYRQVGFIKSKGDRAMYGEDNEMIFSLTGKSKKKDAGQLWRERYNKFRKKITSKIKKHDKCKQFWKKAPSAMEAPGPVHRLARGSKKRTRKKRRRKKRGGNGECDHSGACEGPWYRPAATAREEEKEIYNTKSFLGLPTSAETMYCHHLDEEGKHCVLNKISSANARKCKGVIMFNFPEMYNADKRFYCATARAQPPTTAGHDVCTKERCPFMAEDKECPYMKCEEGAKENKEGGRKKKKGGDHFPGEVL